jgi:hypothetical protein
LHGEDKERIVGEEEFVAINPEVDGERMAPPLQEDEGKHKSAELESGMPARRLS